MRARLLLFIILFQIEFAFGQAGVGIGVAAPDASAALHVQPPTDNKGMLIPRLTTAQRNLVVAPAEGLLVYDTDINALMHYNGSWQTVGMPAGAIIMWSGVVVPNGWALCDGSGGRPDLRARFIIGNNGTYPLGTSGGSSSITLAVAQLPGHSHGITDPGHNHINGSYDRLLRTQGVESGKTIATVDSSEGEPVLTESAFIASSTTGITVNPTGNGQAINILPPYYALAFIMKL